MQNAVLKIVGGKQDGKLIPLQTKKFLIGREQDCHLRPSSDSVSRHHCAISIDEYSVRVRDLGSSNGTYLNGQRLVGTQEAVSGDRLKIGTLEFEIQFQKEGVPVPAESGSNTTFSLDDFQLDAADPTDAIEETALMHGDTAVISRSANQMVDEAESANSEVEAAIESPRQPVTQPPQMAHNGQPDPAFANQQMAQPGMPYPYPGQGMPGYPPMQQPGYPYGMPQQPFNPYMPMPPGYPMQQPQYGMPYPQMYPQQYQQPFPQQSMPGYPAQPPAPAPGQAEDFNDDDDEYEDEEELRVVLPPPEETGLKEEKKPEAGGKPATPAPNPAADILKKYSERR